MAGVHINIEKKVYLTQKKYTLPLHIMSLLPFVISFRSSLSKDDNLWIAYCGKQRWNHSTWTKIPKLLKIGSIPILIALYDNILYQWYNDLHHLISLQNYEEKLNTNWDWLILSTNVPWTIKYWVPVWLIFRSLKVTNRSRVWAISYD